MPNWNSKVAFPLDSKQAARSSRAANAPFAKLPVSTR